MLFNGRLTTRSSLQSEKLWRIFPQASCLSSPVRQSITSLALWETNSAKKIFLLHRPNKSKENVVVDSDVVAVVNVFS